MAVKPLAGPPFDRDGGELGQRVLALDPGERVGMAWCRMSPDRMARVKTNVLPWVDCAHWLVEHRHDFDVTVYETWIPRRINGTMDWIEGDALISAQFVGQLKLAAWLGEQRLKSYGPINKEAFQSSMPARLRRRQAASSEQHDKDALMHLWGYYFENWMDTTPDKVKLR